MRLKDRVALVTGSSRGGTEIAIRLAADGAKIFLHARADAESIQPLLPRQAAAGVDARLRSWRASSARRLVMVTSAVSTPP